jgi:hypothetical protein
VIAMTKRSQVSVAALCCALIASPAFADNYVAKDGNGNLITMVAKNVTGILHQLHIMEGQIGGTGAPQAVNVDASGNVSVTCASGCSGSGTSTLANASPAAATEGATTTPLSLDLSRNLRTTATQAGTWNITNISGTVSLPTGAATATNQTNVQGTKAPGTAATNSLLTGGVYTSAGITLTNGQQAALQFDSTGHLLTVGGGGAVTAASGAYAAGSLASGAGVDGWDLTQGAKADTACATDNGTCSIAALAKRIAQNLTTLNTTAGSGIPTGSNTIGNVGIVAGSASIGTVGLNAGTALVGKVGIDQTTPGTTNAVQDAATGATGSAVPAKAQYAGAVSSGNLTGLIQADASAAISVSTATTTQIVALSSTKKIYVTSFDVIAGGTGNITFEYGTGSNCGTGTTVLTGAYNLTAQAGIAKGNGLGAVLVVRRATPSAC